MDKPKGEAVREIWKDSYKILNWQFFLALIIPDSL